MKKKRQPSKLYYTPIEAAEVLSVHVKTIHRWLREGTLKGIRFGKSWRIPNPIPKPE